ncbi:MAG: nuclear transport factor 2 family protein [Candidatus Acidiferrales bacterium]
MDQLTDILTAISHPTRRAMIAKLAWLGLTIGLSAFLLTVDGIGGVKMEDSLAVKIALAHIDAWSRHDWDKTKELLVPNVHALVTTTMPNFGGSEFTGIDNYMAFKVKAAQLIEPGGVQVIGTIGDESNALTLFTFRIGLGPGTMVTMARACLYLVDENKKIKEERDSFFVLSSKL